MWAQVPDVTVINEASETDWWVAWLPLLAAVITVVASAIVQFRVQRGEFRNRSQQWTDQRTATADEWDKQQAAAAQQWERQHEADRQQLKLTRELEREKQFLPERIRYYGDFINALDDALVAGIAAAQRVTAASSPMQPSVEDLSMLLNSLGAEKVPVRQSAIDEGWEPARTRADRAGARAVLVTGDNDRRTTMQGALFQLWQCDPIGDPQSFIRDDANPIMSGGAASDLRRARIDAERAAINELGLCHQPTG